MAKKVDTSKLCDEDYMALTSVTCDAVRQFPNGRTSAIKVACTGRKNKDGDWTYRIGYPLMTDHYKFGESEWSLAGLQAHGVTIFLVRLDRVEQKKGV